MRIKATTNNDMKNLYPILIVFVIFLTAGCTVIESIFEAGFWAGLIAAVIAILVIFLIVKIIKAIVK